MHNREIDGQRAVAHVPEVVGEWYDRIAGLLLGSDDYMVTPYAAGDPLARLARLVERARHRARDVRALTPRELEVLGSWARGSGTSRSRDG